MQMHVSFHTLPGLPRALVIIEIDFIVFQAAPEALDDDIILGSALAVHADAHLVFLQQINILWTRKMAALVTVDNQGLALSQREVDRDTCGAAGRACSDSALDRWP